MSDLVLGGGGGRYSDLVPGGGGRCSDLVPGGEVVDHWCCPPPPPPPIQ